MHSVCILGRSKDHRSVCSNSTANPGHIAADGKSAAASLGIILAVSDWKRAGISSIRNQSFAILFINPGIRINIANEINGAAFSTAGRTKFNILSLGFCLISINGNYLIYAAIIPKSGIAAKGAEPQASAVTGIAGVIHIVSRQVAALKQCIVNHAGLACINGGKILIQGCIGLNRCISGNAAIGDVKLVHTLNAVASHVNGTAQGAASVVTDITGKQGNTVGFHINGAAPVDRVVVG